MRKTSDRYQTRPGGAAAALAYQAVRYADWLGTTLRRSNSLMLPVSAALSQRSLWGRLPRRPAERPDKRLRLALTFDLDYQADTAALPGLIELVGRVGARMSVVAIGRLVEADPVPYRQALAAGHEIVNHTWSHPDNPILNPDREFWHLTVDEMADEIGRAQDIFAQKLGVRPRGFRTPHFKDAPRMLAALARFTELRYVSTALASKAPLAVPYMPTMLPLAGELSLHFSSSDHSQNSDIMMIPLTPCPQHRWSPFCSYHAIRQPPNAARGAGMHSLDEFADLWQHMLASARPDGFASVYFDPLDVMRDKATADVFEAMLCQAVAEGWELVTLGEVEQAWRTILSPSLPAHVQQAGT